MKNSILILFLIITFSSFGQKFTISATRQNIFYKGLDNPIEVVIEDTKCDNISVSTTNGKIEKYNDCSYILRADSIGKANISVYRKNKKDSIFLGAYQFKVIDIPNPTPRLADKKNGEIDKNLLLALKSISTSIDGFDIDITIHIKSYSVFIVWSNDSITYKEINGNKFTDELKDEFKKLKSGDRVYFVDIIAVLPDGKDRYLNSMKFKIK